MSGHKKIEINKNIDQSADIQKVKKIRKNDFLFCLIVSMSVLSMFLYLSFYDAVSISVPVIFSLTQSLGFTHSL